MRILLLLLSILPVMTLAADVTELSMDAATCWLRERGSGVKDNPISVAGKDTDTFGCVAFIKDEEFTGKFEFCVYSGFEMARGSEAEYYSCRYSRELDSFMFNAYMSNEGLDYKPDLVCHFMCYAK